MPGLRGCFQVPGDKSISHRSLMLSGIVPGTHRISGLLESADVFATMRCMQLLGVRIEKQEKQNDEQQTQNGRIYQAIAPKALQEPGDILDCQNSGTSIRLLSGLLAGQGFYCVLTGDAAIRKRPMGRVLKPLQSMGALIHGRHQDQLAPVTILPAKNSLQGVCYEMPVASAQVKSALLLAGLYAEGNTEITESCPSRDHTERMLQYLGVSIQEEKDHTGKKRIILAGNLLQETLSRHSGNLSWDVPGDFSSAAFFIVAATCIPGSEIRIENVSVNPLRTGLMRCLSQIGADIKIENTRTHCGEPVADMIVRSAALKGNLTITEQDVPSMIDEIPILTIAGLFLEGTLTVTGAEELRKKESDRIQAMADELAKLGVTITVFEDGFSLTGDPGRRLQAPSLPLFAHHDHRIVMALSVLNEIADPKNPWEMEGRDWVQVSYPGFFNQFEQLRR